MAPRKAKQASAKEAAPLKKKAKANGFKLPDPIEPGQILVDMLKNKWRLGKSIGQGGFGEIYLAAEDLTRPVPATASYVVKIEPHSNGPLFTEMHCYMRIAKPDVVDAWMKEKKLKRLGMPKYLGSGSHQYNGQKYRFMVMERFGSDLQKILNQHSKRLSFKTVYQVAIQILDVLEYIHSKEYIHADIKASNLLVGYQPATTNQVFLVDYGLACRYANDGKHKEYKYDGRKAHDGTIEFTSRDAHIGAHSRRGDMEILGYNLVQWLCSQLPWEDILQDCKKVAERKRDYMGNINKLVTKCFPDTKPPGITEYLEYVANLTFDEKPDYERCRNILRDGLKVRGYKDDGKLVFMAATPKAAPKRAKSKFAGGKRGKKRRSEEEENIAEFSPTKQLKESPRTPCRSRNYIRINTRLCHRDSAIGVSLSKPSQPDFYVDAEDWIIEKENQKMLARKQKERPKRLQLQLQKRDTSLDNPTPQMLAIMARIREKSISPSICQKRHRHNSNCNGAKHIPTYEIEPTEFTHEMELVMQRLKERLEVPSDSEGYASSSSSSSTSSFRPNVSIAFNDSMDIFESEDSNDSVDSLIYNKSRWKNSGHQKSRHFNSGERRHSISNQNVLHQQEQQKPPLLIDADKLSRLRSNIREKPSPFPTRITRSHTKHDVLLVYEELTVC